MANIIDGLDDIDKEEINVTVVDPNYGAQLLEFITDDDLNETADINTDGGDWSDVKPGEYRVIQAELPGEQRGGISGGGSSACIKPGTETPVNANETATSTTTDATTDTGDTGGGGGGASPTPKQDESAAIGTAQVPNLDASGQGSSGTYAGRKFTNIKASNEWYVGPIKTKVVKIPGILSTWKVTIETWSIYTNLFYDIHNEIEDINLDKGGQGEYALFVREINDGNVNPGWSKGKPRWSNHATGTGIDVNAPYHPYYKKSNRPTDDKRHWGVSGLQKLNYLLNTKYKSAVKGGYTYYDDMHFEVVKTPTEFGKIIKQLNKEMNLDARAAAIASGQIPITAKYPPVVVTPRKKKGKK